MKSPFLFLSSLTLIFIACTEDPEPLPLENSYDHGVLIVNEGNFFSGDGEISHFDPVSGEVTNNLFQQSNGVILAAYIEQLRVYGEHVFIIDSQQGAPKLVIVNNASFMEKGRVTGLEIPRDVAVIDNRLFIADWGNYDEQGNYTNPTSFIAVADITGGPVTGKIHVPSRPESIVEFNGHLYVNCQVSQEILKINPTTLEITESIHTDALPVELMVIRDKLMLYSTLDQKVLLEEVDAETLALTGKTYNIPNATSLILDEQGNGFVLTTLYSEDFSSSDNRILHFSESGTGPVSTVYEAKNLKGIGLEPITQQLYIADDNGIQGNGTVIITDLQGNEIQKLEVGRVPSKFHFY